MRTASNFLRVFVLGAMLSLSALAPSARAQCLPDGLNGGPCCGGTGVTLPTFPALQAQSVRFVSFNACTPAASALWCANLGAPAPMQVGGALVCGAFDIPIRIRSCGLPIAFWGGSLRAFYSRNWIASPPSGTTSYMVWRFVVNGDLKPTISLNTNQNFRPICATTFTNVYFSGYIDYALDCNTNQWRIAWNLNHECDGVHHALGTARPAPSSGLHPSRSYSFVGPGNTFVVSSTGPLVSNGPITQEALRPINWFLVPFACNFEEPATGFFQSLNDFCICSVGGANQYTTAMVTASGACGSAVAPSSNGPFVQKRLGSWNSANAFPGTQTLLFDFGYLDYSDACFGSSGPEWFEGCETLNGFTGIDINGAPMGTQFEDLGSANQSATAPATLIGAPHVVYYLLNFNMP